MNTIMLQSENVLLNLAAEEKLSAFDEVVTLLSSHKQFNEAKKASIMEQLVERETNTTFAVGHSIAIPHLSCDQVDDFVFFYARSAEGIDFDACDHGLVHHLFFALIPEEKKCGWLKILAKMAKTLSNYELREELMNMSDSKVVAEVLTERLFTSE